MDAHKMVSIPVRLDDELAHKFKVALADRRERAQHVFTQAAVDYVENWQKGLK